MKILAALSIIAVLLAAGSAQAAPKAGPSAVYKDWTVICDNGLTCVALLLPAPEGEGTPDGAVSIGRDATPSGRVRLTLGFDAQTVTQPIVVAIDGKPVQTLALSAVDRTNPDDNGVRATLRDDAAALALVGAMANGNKLVLRAGAGAEATISLAGLAAALRFMDDKQRRAGTVTALVATGPRPASAMPAPPPLPVVQRSRQRPKSLGEDEIRRLSAIVRARLPKDGNWECDGLNADKDAASFSADGFALDAKLAVITLRCGLSGAYNHMSGLFAVDRASGAARDLLIEEPGSEGLLESEAPGIPVVSNYSFEDKTLALGGYAGGRSVGDCGAWVDWIWDGTRFAVTRTRFMPVCRGVPRSDWPNGFRAIVP